MSASETPKSRFETSSFPPVSTPAPAPKPLSNRSCCHFSGSCFGCNESGTSLTGGAGRFLPPPRAITGLFRTGPPPPARPAPTPPRLMISSSDMSILSAMMAAPLRGLHFRPRCAAAGSGRGGGWAAEARSRRRRRRRCGCACGAGTGSRPGCGWRTTRTAASAGWRLTAAAPTVSARGGGGRAAPRRADALSAPQARCPGTTARWCGGSARTASTCTASSSG
uniref:Uncharacterized protein n=1 Tax=Strigops habroptila TaxID=2489341 RepID=A0A672UE70_STRHB